jgi:hypothetical protein
MVLPDVLDGLMPIARDPLAISKRDCASGIGNIGVDAERSALSGFSYGRFIF